MGVMTAWAPEPPDEREDSLSIVSSDQLIFAQGEDSDDLQEDADADTLVVQSGYTLFSEHNLLGNTSDEDDQDEDPDDQVSCGQATDLVHNSLPNTSGSSAIVDTFDSHSFLGRRRRSEVPEVAGLFEATRPSGSVGDIAIDCEEVRAAMVTITLPPSAFPPWAVGISDLELSNQIQRLLGKMTPNKEP